MKCSDVTNRSFLTRPLRVAAVAIALAWSAGFSPSAKADLIFGVTTISGEAGSSSNSLDVTLTNTGATDAYIAGFSFEITAAGTDVTFLNVTTSTTSVGYIFTPSANSSFGPDITLAVSPDGHTISANDNYAIANSDVTLAHGHTIGLGHVNFSISSTAAVSPISIIFTDYPSTGVNDSAGNQATIVVPTDAHINVTVPEPTTLASFGVGAIGLIVAMKSRRKVSSAA